jgi:cysteine-rich repeat protein
VVLLLLSAAGWAPAVAGKIYWTQEGRVLRAEGDGSGIEVVLDGIDPGGLEFGGGKLYWSDLTLDAILRADPDGSNAETVVAGGIHPLHLALDLTHGRIYWTESGEIWRARFDGTEIEGIVAGYSSIEGLALDVAEGTMYFSEPSSGIYRADLDGTNVQTLYYGCCPAGIALDLATEHMYVADPDGCIRKARLDGTSIGCFTGSTLSEVAYYLALDTGSRDLYWSIAWFDGGIWRKNVDFGGPEHVLPDQTRNARLAVDPSAACGNGVVEAGEGCDDGNDVAGDGCEPDCTETLPVPASSAGSVTVTAMLLLLALAAARRSRCG